MTANRLIGWTLLAYVALTIAFILAPIVSSFVFSFNAGRFPSLPWQGFSTDWYAAVLTDPSIRSGLINSLIVAACSATIATLLGFTAAYTDYRYKFTGKAVYVALAMLPPNVPVMILGLAMLVYQSQFSLVGALHSVIIAHVVYCAPFAMALVRLRLSQMDPDLEAAAWNLGAGQAQALRHVILPFALPSILAAFFLTMAVSFDEFAMAWFVSGFNETLPVRILVLLQREVSPRVNAIGSIVFLVTIVLALTALALFSWRRTGGRAVRPSTGSDRSDSA
ncbi:ABC transporter permease [Labrys wisconsinensis]|uniref:Spermidine/putrescine transport system permease protein n=1 Tax=Labrys wisconsinensis TaxID=425677 RepID=A0ABU0J4G5_9HYPH|nr:ABC transporter permease [Labrys wisconsinensis]MDQ0469166.1 spermidine/putrescine transport system permease protein [Labrys wisconsinensis]